MFIKQFEKLYSIRDEILNMPLYMWRRFHELNGRKLTAREFLDSVGLPNVAMRADLMTQHENEFFDEIYKLHRERQK